MNKFSIDTQSIRYDLKASSLCKLKRALKPLNSDRVKVNSIERMVKVSKFGQNTSRVQRNNTPMFVLPSIIAEGVGISNSYSLPSKDLGTKVASNVLERKSSIKISTPKINYALKPLESGLNAMKTIEKVYKPVQVEVKVKDYKLLYKEQKLVNKASQKDIINLSLEAHELKKHLKITEETYKAEVKALKRINEELLENQKNPHNIYGNAGSSILPIDKAHLSNRILNLDKALSDPHLSDSNFSKTLVEYADEIYEKNIE